jgi:hypothetical protein
MALLKSHGARQACSAASLVVVAAREQQLAMTVIQCQAARAAVSLERSLLKTKKNVHVRGTRSDLESSFQDSDRRPSGTLPLQTLPLLKNVLALDIILIALKT